MRWLCTLARTFGLQRKNTKHRARQILQLEALESRLAPYSATGNVWPHPQLVTLSFVPDGTVIATSGTQQVHSNLFATFNAKFGSAAAWQNIVLKAAQTWAQQTNLNFAVVADDGAASGGGNYQQGDPGMGDIRIGGYAFGNSVLGMTYYPPAANNYSIAGDVAFNTGEPFNNGSTYDLYTVACHEIGHALGLGESSVPQSIEYANYNGVKNSLSSDDIAGIRNQYSSNNPRTPDTFAGASTPNNSFANATNINSYISSTSLTASLPKLDMTTTNEVEYFTFTVPSATTGTLTVNVQSSGLSLLAPKATVYAANQNTVLGSATALGHYQGATLSVKVTGVTAGQQLYVKVQGTDNTAFSTGAYGLSLSFGSAAAPTIASPNTQTLNGSPLHGGGGYAQNTQDAVYLDSVPVIAGITPDTGGSNSDGVTNATNISFYGDAPVGTSVQVYQVGNNSNGNGDKTTLIGTVLPIGNAWTLNYTSHTFNQGTYTFYATATTLLGLGTTSAPSTTFTVTIDTTPPPPPLLAGFAPDLLLNGYSSSNTPTLLGSAEPNSTVTVFESGKSHPIGTVAADSLGLWSFTTNGLGNNASYTFTVNATDLAGNVSVMSAPLTLTVDQQTPLQPQIEGITPDTGAHNNDGITNASRIKIVGKADPNDTVEVFQNGVAIGTTQANSSGAWTFDNTGTALAQGTYNFTATGMNIAGSVSQLSNPYTAVIMLTPPPTPVFAGITEQTNGGGQQQLQIAGTAVANSTVTVTLNGSVLGTTNANGQGIWSYQYNPNAAIPNGSYRITASITDIAGNVSTATFNLLIGMATPSAPQLTAASIINQSGGIQTIAAPTLTGTAAAGAVITIVDCGIVLGTVVANASGVWTFTTPTLASGNHSISIFDTDVHGNESLLSNPLAFKV